MDPAASHVTGDAACRIRGRPEKESFSEPITLRSHSAGQQTTNCYPIANAVVGHKSTLWPKEQAMYTIFEHSTILQSILNTVNPYPPHAQIS